MRILKLVLFSISILSSFQADTVNLRKLLPENILKATLNIKLHPEAGLNIILEHGSTGENKICLGIWLQINPEECQGRRPRSKSVKAVTTLIGSGPACKVKDLVRNSSGIMLQYQVLQKYGYAVETHSVTTEDGYVLRMQRIPRGRKETANGKFKPVVLLMHGMMGSSSDWLALGPNNSLAYMLADAGFDVWLGNSRGNTWSRNHVRLDPDIDRKRFWDFSFEDCGRYDIPAKIDFIIEKTGQKKIFYIGHSQGTTQYFVMASLKPHYNDRIALMLALAPSTYMKNTKSRIAKLAAPYIDIIAAITNHLNVREILRHSDLVVLVAILGCSDGSPLQGFCASIIYMIFGFNGSELDRSRLAVLFSNIPAGASFKMLAHYAQEIQSGYFRQFDYGRSTNLIKYNSIDPPNFNLSAVTSPVTLYQSQNDVFAAKPDVDRLARQLPNLVKRKIIDYKLFNHVDFIFAKHCRELINNDILNQLMEFNKSNYISTTSTKEGIS